MLRLLAPMTPLLLSMLAAVIGYGIQLSVVPVQAKAGGFSEIGLGVLGSAYFGGLLLGCLLVPPLIRSVGHARGFCALAAVLAATSLVQPLAFAVVPWVLCRLMVGICVSGIYMIVESWLNARSTNETRGRLISTYVALAFLGIMLGQFLAALETSGFAPFALSAILISLASIPMLLSRQAQPAAVPPFRFRPLRLLAVSPAGLLAVFVTGISQGCIWGLGAVFALAKGLDASSAALFMGVAILGSALAQMPVGYLADRMHRLLLLTVLGVLGIVFGLAISLLPLPAWGVYVLGFLLGATLMPPYAVAAAYIYDRVPPEEYVETSAGVLLINATGGILGPFVAGVVMQSFGSNTVFITTSVPVALLAVFLFLAYRADPSAGPKHARAAAIGPLPEEAVPPPAETR